MSNYTHLGHSILVAIPVALVPVPYYTQIMTTTPRWPISSYLLVQYICFDLDYSSIMHMFVLYFLYILIHIRFLLTFNTLNSLMTQNYRFGLKIYYSTDMVNFTKPSISQYLLIIILISLLS